MMCYPGIGLKLKLIDRLNNFLMKEMDFLQGFINLISYLYPYEEVAEP